PHEPLLSGPPLRRGPVVSRGFERQVPRAPDRSDPRNGDAVQRSVRHAPRLLSRVAGRRLFRRRGQGDSRGASRAAAARSAGPGRVRRLRLRAGKPDALRGYPRPARRLVVDVSKGNRRGQAVVLRAPRVGRAAAPGRGAVLPAAAGDLCTQPSAVLRWPGAGWRVPDRRARQIAPVRMTGNYGGELLRRVRAFKAVEPLPRLFGPDLMRDVRRAGETYDSLLRGHPLSFAVFKQAPWHHYGLLALEETQVALRSPYLDNDLVRTVFRAPASVLTNNDVCLRLIAEGDPVLRQIRTDRGIGATGVSAAASRALLEFLFKAEYAYDYGMPQWVARIDHVLSGLHLERLFLGRHKFHHFRIWYRDVLPRYVRDMLLDPRTLSRPYIERKGLEAVVDGHLKGGRN